MLTGKGKAILCALLACCLAVAALGKARLDELAPARGQFRELLYVPNGLALKVSVFGFDAPYADALWVRGLLYYSDNIRASQSRGDRNAKYRYLYRLNDIITNLNPRFARAYLDGGMFLLTTGKENHIRDAIRLFEKGLSAYDRAASAGEPMRPDARWKLHVYIAQAYDASLRLLDIERGDRPAAHADRLRAREHYAQACRMPGVPGDVALAFVGLQQQLAGSAKVEERYDAMVAVWKRLAADASQSSRELKEYAARQLQELEGRRATMLRVRTMEAQLSSEAAKLRAGLRDDARAEGAIRAALSRIPSPLDGDKASPGAWVLLPGDTVLNFSLAALEAQYQRDSLFDAIYDYYYKHGERYPARLEELVTDGLLEKLPVHPLAAAGYAFSYDPATGYVAIVAPGGGTAGAAGEGGRRTVRVAAVQLASVFGEKETNRTRLAAFIREAAGKGARIVVAPEACIPGYCDLGREIYWEEGGDGPAARNVKRAAERADGPSFAFFSPLAKELGVYLTVPIIEREGTHYYITVLLVGSCGELALRHRKHELWTVADTGFASASEEPVAVAQTPYGRIGLMICRDMHVLPEELSKLHADIVLHSAAFYGPNFEGYLLSNKFAGMVKNCRFALVLADWGVKEKPEGWEGYGLSRVLDVDGALLARSAADVGEEIVYADIPLN